MAINLFGHFGECEALPHFMNKWREKGWRRGRVCWGSAIRRCGEGYHVQEEGEVKRGVYIAMVYMERNRKAAGVGVSGRGRL